MAWESNANSCIGDIVRFDTIMDAEKYTGILLHHAISFKKQLHDSNC